MELSPIGRIQKLYGKAGEIAVLLYSNAPEHNFDYFFIPVDGINMPIYFKLIHTKGQNKIIVTLNDFERNDWAEEWIGKEILYPTPDCLAEEEEEGFEALIGFEVVDKNKGTLGVIAEFLDYPNNPVYRIDYNGKDIFIPIHQDFILKVDDKKNQIKTLLPEGLVEAYL